MQPKPDYLDQLIALAIAKTGSAYKLAQHLNCPRQTISQWKAGVKTCPVGDVALMAQVAGLDPEAWTLRAVADSYKGTPKGEKLSDALKKALVATGAAVATFGVNAASIGTDYLIRCILC